MKPSAVRRLEKIEQATSDAGDVKSRWHRLIVDSGPIAAPIAIDAEMERQQTAMMESGTARQGDNFIVRSLVGLPVRGSLSAASGSSS